ARGVTAADFDEDGDADVYVSTYRLQPNYLWLNTGEIPMQEVAGERGAAGIAKDVINYTGGISYPVCGHTIGSAWGDLDEDGHIDLFVGNFSHPPAYQDRPQFLRNQGPPEWAFEDMSEGAGLAWQESFASPALADFDNDGDLDLYFTTVYDGDHSVLYRNDGEWTFTDVTAEAGISAANTYQGAWADYDNDGDLDLLTGGKLYENRAATGHWLKLRVDGPGAAIGAVARVRIGERVLTRAVCSSTGQGNQNEMTLHFGLGDHAGPVELQIVWPGGASRTITVQPDQTVSVSP
ncbi:MAG: CRTAC1 family protein, partial [Armatimonadota bacterium]